MTKFFLISALFLTLSTQKAFGAVDSYKVSSNQVTTTIKSDESGAVASRFSIEAMAQAHSVSNTSSPWLGIAASYQFVKRVSVGLRGFVPMSEPVDQSTYSIQAFSRIFCNSYRNNQLFVEPDYALNFYKFFPFQSMGAAVGVLNHIAPGVAVGATGGIEAAHYIVDSIGLERNANLVVYPKVGLISDFYF